MPSLVHFLAPLALLLPVPPGDGATTPGAGIALGGGLLDQSDDASLVDPWPGASEADGPPLASPDGPARGMMSDAMAQDRWDQVRIEQRMIIRIAPRGPGGPGFPMRDMFAGMPDLPSGPRFYERKTAKCLSVGGIAGVQIGENDRLMLFMRDQRTIGASLEKSCNARDFYSGFYLERTADGMLCAGRDMLHSRAGASCSISRFRELIPGD
ncbi:hypothetical protein [Novosphingobium lentum]|uniref:hypothetical protein n=1 Tax=Novosphingobium lentum TaxID=145287 RepID=UPI00082AA5CD|nr:hypothetical protein [Novosphingobium lentum]